MVASGAVDGVKYCGVAAPSPRTRAPVFGVDSVGVAVGAGVAAGAGSPAAGPQVGQRLGPWPASSRSATAICCSGVAWSGCEANSSPPYATQVRRVSPSPP